MAQTTDYEIANSSGLVFRGRVNEVLAAVQSSNSGATAPTSTIGGMLWLDTSVSPAVLRRRNSANTDWLAVFNQDNILGTVSQSAGVPTGAIIESGSNANGEFTKFADGTMICRFTVTTSSSGATTKTLPATFINDTYIVVGGTNTSVSASDFTGKFASRATTTVSAVMTNNGQLTATTLQAIAIGQWF